MWCCLVNIGVIILAGAALFFLLEQFKNYIEEVKPNVSVSNTFDTKAIADAMKKQPTENQFDSLAEILKTSLKDIKIDSTPIADSVNKTITALIDREKDIGVYQTMIDEAVKKLNVETKSQFTGVDLRVNTNVKTLRDITLHLQNHTEATKKRVEAMENIKDVTDGALKSYNDNLTLALQAYSSDLERIRKDVTTSITQHDENIQNSVNAVTAQFKEYKHSEDGRKNEHLDSIKKLIDSFTTAIPGKIGGVIDAVGNISSVLTQIRSQLAAKETKTVMERKLNELLLSHLEKEEEEEEDKNEDDESMSTRKPHRCITLWVSLWLQIQVRSNQDVKKDKDSGTVAEDSKKSLDDDNTAEDSRTVAKDSKKSLDDDNTAEDVKSHILNLTSDEKDKHSPKYNVNQNLNSKNTAEVLYWGLRALTHQYVFLKELHKKRKKRLDDVINNLQDDHKQYVTFIQRSIPNLMKKPTLSKVLTNLAEKAKEEYLYFPTQFNAYARLIELMCRRLLNPAITVEGFQNVMLLGPPGVGKTTLASKYHHMLNQLHQISGSNRFISISGRDLVGTSAEDSVFRVRYYIFQSLDSVLFIDEAYTLCSFPPSETQRAAVDELVYWMEIFKGVQTIIFAGYEEQMLSVYECNPGLARRIPYNITLALPTNIEEYAKIAVLQCIEKENKKLKEKMMVAEEVKDDGNAKDWIKFINTCLQKHQTQVNMMGYGIVNPLISILYTFGFRISQYVDHDELKQYKHAKDFELHFVKDNNFPSNPTRYTLNVKPKLDTTEWVFQIENEKISKHFKNEEWEIHLPSVGNWNGIDRKSIKFVTLMFNSSAPSVLHTSQDIKQPIKITTNFQKMDKMTVTPLTDAMKTAIAQSLQDMFASTVDIKMRLHDHRIHESAYLKAVDASAQNLASKYNTTEKNESEKLNQFYKKSGGKDAKQTQYW